MGLRVTAPGIKGLGPAGGGYPSARMPILYCRAAERRMYSAPDQCFLPSGQFCPRKSLSSCRSSCFKGHAEGYTTNLNPSTQVCISQSIIIYIEQTQSRPAQMACSACSEHVLLERLKSFIPGDCIPCLSLAISRPDEVKGMIKQGPRSVRSHWV